MRPEEKVTFRPPKLDGNYTGMRVPADPDASPPRRDTSPRGSMPIEQVPPVDFPRPAATSADTARWDGPSPVMNPKGFPPPSVSDGSEFVPDAPTPGGS